MRIAGYLPLLMALLLALAARRTAARCTPRAGARTLAGSAVIAAACSTWALTLLALTMLDDLPPLAALDDQPTLDLPEPVPGYVALAAGTAVLCGGLRLLRDVRRRVAVHRGLRAIGAPEQELVVADWSTPMAVAVPGTARRGGHLLITTGILRLLDADERRVVLAHEQGPVSRAR